jgi:hypothetical protein
MQKNILRGSILLAPAICLICLLTLFQLLIHLGSYSLTKTFSQTIDLLRTRQKIKEKLVKDALTQNISPSSSRYECLYNLEQNICWFKSAVTYFDINTERKNFPWINYSALLKNETPCSLSPYTNNLVTQTGHRLSLNSIYWDKSCKSLASSHEKVILKSNLELSILQPVKNSHQANLILTTGFTEIRNQLILTGDTIILAGGDIHISELIAPEASRISLISTTGAVVVDKLSSGLQILAKAWQGVFIAGNFLEQEQKLLPNIATKEILVINMS